MATPKVGDSVKVYLPGETPWAECVGIAPDGSWMVGRIDNHLLCTEGHGIRLNDLVLFVPLDAPRCPWQAAHLRLQP